MKYQIYFEAVEDSGTAEFLAEARYAVGDFETTYTARCGTVSAAHRKLAEFRRDFRDEIKNHKVVKVA